MKLNEYIENQQKQIKKQTSEELRNNINLSIEKETFKEKVEQAQFKFSKDLISLARSQVFEFKELERIVDEYKKSQEFEINIYSQPMPEQYFINLKADFHLNKEGVYFNIFSSGYDKNLEEKYFSFEEFKKLDFEEFLVDCLNEFD